MTELSLKTKSNEFKVLTQNVCTDIDEIPVDRIKLLISSINYHSPDIFFLQEAALLQHRNSLHEAFSSKYHLLFSNHTHVTYRWKSFIPFTTITFINAILLALYLYDNQSKYILLTFILLQLLAVILLPFIFAKILSCCRLPACKQLNNHTFDSQALSIGIKKHLNLNGRNSDIEPPKILLSKPFDDLGHKFLCKNILRWPLTWIQYTFLRHGYMIVKYNNMLIINAHLATGVINDKRMKQVAELHTKINESLWHKTNRKNDVNHIIIGCDCNAHYDQPEIKYIENTMKFIDCWKYCNPNDIGYTWSNDNELVSNGPNQRCDYIFYKYIKNQNWTAAKAELTSTTKPYLSDHFGVLVVFQIVK